MIQLHIIGCGGIGSYFCDIVYDLKSKQQLQDISQINVYDPDEVEMKNTFYQNFKVDEIGLLKVDSMNLRYGYMPHAKRIESFDSMVSDKSIIVTCVDNWQTRDKLFTWYFGLDETTKDKITWIDLRSHGNQVACYVSGKTVTLERMKKTLPKADVVVTEEGANSCQSPLDLVVGKIQLGNRIIATIGSQVLLHLQRKTLIGNIFEYYI